MATRVSASMVSRQLKAAGVMTSGESRRHRHEGVFVQQRGTDVVVHIDIDTPRHRREIRAMIWEILTAKGRVLEESGLSTWWIWASRQER